MIGPDWAWEEMWELWSAWQGVTLLLCGEGGAPLEAVNASDGVCGCVNIC